MGYIEYIGAIFNRAAKGSVLLTDRLTILLVPFSTFALWGLGVEMTASLQETFWLGVAITVTGVVLLRLAAAGYFLWKDDKAEKKRLQHLYDRERLRPDRLQREASHAHAIKLRNELGECLAKVVNFAEVKGRLPSAVERLGVSEAEYGKASMRAREIIHALSYDVALRIAAHELHALAASIGGSRSSDVDSDLDRLQALKKITFRIIFKGDSGELGEFLSLIEVENLMGKMQFDDGPFRELQIDVKDNPGLLHRLRVKIESGDADGL